MPGRRMRSPGVNIRCGARTRIHTLPHTAPRTLTGTFAHTNTHSHARAFTQTGQSEKKPEIVFSPRRSQWEPVGLEPTTFGA